MSKEVIEIIGARVNNLKNINVSLPRNKLIVFTGKSGSGKSSLAFNTIHAEGQRRYLETFNAYARQFIGYSEKPDVDKITGLSPVVSIEQKSTVRSPRSTVGTITEIYDYLRLLFAKTGIAYSYNTAEKMISYSNEEIINLINEKYKNERIIILSPIIRSRKGNYKELFKKILQKGYIKVRVDGELLEITPGMKLDRYVTHDIEIVIDKFTIKESNKNRLNKSINTALINGEDSIIIVSDKDKKQRYFSKNLMCPSTGISYKKAEPNSFSFNSPKGACKDCNGLGFIEKADIEKIIPDHNLSINTGGIAPIEGKNANWIKKQINIIGKKYSFNLNTPIKKISKEGINAILYGLDDSFYLQNDMIGFSKNYKIQFKGIVNFIEEQYKISDIPSISRWAKKYMKEFTCHSCNGSRLNKESSSYKIADKNIVDLVNMDIKTLYKWILNLENKLNASQKIISQQILKEISKRLEFILDVGLDYLTLNRNSNSLSGGEAQRIRLATQIGTKLTSVLYILDEPSIGLHQRDNMKLISSLKKLRDIGNTVIVVEHDKEIMMESDYIVDLGPEAGQYGGFISFSGEKNKFIKTNNITSNYLNGIIKIDIPVSRRQGNGKFLHLKGASGNNLKNTNIKIPLGTLCCITGVSGSGKSTLITKTLYPILSNYFYRSVYEPLEFDSITGIENIDKVIEVDQNPIGRSPRSNPATYTGLFSKIRELFANVNESKVRGYKSGRFSFNVVGGRCETCKGGGLKVLEMKFLPDVLVTCENCNGKRYTRDTLEIKYKGKSIADVLEMSIDTATIFFQNIPSIYNKLKSLQEVGLGYIRLGQSSTTLSGGESQRVKLASELSKKSTGKTIYILDEPTTGLHFEDIKLLLKVVNQLINIGNTVLIIEHNLDIIKTADYIFDMGPEGGIGGGEIICNGSPEFIVKQNIGFTSKFLKDEIKSK
ncbi:MAG: excinuclease ABC subunit A [Flavobacteriales bacterium]|nr:excinuclease ABC subunit A [Flavobacteriales bacterium]